MPDADRHTIHVDRQGRALIPKPLRSSMGLGNGGEVVAWLEGQRLVLEPRDVLLQRLKSRYQNVGGSMADELIHERRAEAVRDEID